MNEESKKELLLTQEKVITMLENIPYHDKKEYNLSYAKYVFEVMNNLVEIPNE